MQVDKNTGEYCILWQDDLGNSYQNEVKDICSLTGISPAHPGVYAEELPGQAPEGAEKRNSVEDKHTAVMMKRRFTGTGCIL